MKKLALLLIGSTAAFMLIKKQRREKAPLPGGRLEDEDAFRAQPSFQTAAGPTSTDTASVSASRGSDSGGATAPGPSPSNTGAGAGVPPAPAPSGPSGVPTLDVGPSVPVQGGREGERAGDVMVDVPSERHTG